MSIITLTTDFGGADAYVGQMKGVILSLAPGAQVVDISHHIPPHDIRAGAMVLEKIAGQFPDNTVHLGVVDPGVGSSRKKIVIQACYSETRQSTEKSAFFVGPDNGLFSLAAPREARTGVWEITNTERLPVSEGSSTFEGRDVFAPVAAFLARGTKPSEFGPQKEDSAEEGAIVELENYPQVQKEGYELRGEIVHFDVFGNAITNIKKSDLTYTNISIEACFQDKLCALPLVRTYDEIPVGEAAALINSEGALEISCKGASAKDLLRLPVGAAVKITRK